MAFHHAEAEKEVGVVALALLRVGEPDGAGGRSGPRWKRSGSGGTEDRHGSEKPKNETHSSSYLLRTIRNIIAIKSQLQIQTKHVMERV
jgi:hypothetical protein